MGDRWDRLPGEGTRAYHAFLIYRDLGPARTLEEVYRVVQETTKSKRSRGKSPTTHASGRINGWSSSWNWVERARAWDRHVQDERDRIALQCAREQEEIRLRCRWKRIVTADKMFDRATDLLARPIDRETVSRDGKAVIIEPAGWTQRDIATFARTASDLVEVDAGSPIHESDARKPRIILPGDRDFTIRVEN